MMLEGTLCESCGEFINDGEDAGYPRKCAGCVQEAGGRPEHPRTQVELDAYLIREQKRKQEQRRVKHRAKRQRQKARKTAALRAAAAEGAGREGE